MINCDVILRRLILHLPDDEPDNPEVKLEKVGSYLYAYMQSVFKDKVDYPPLISLLQIQNVQSLGSTRYCPLHLALQICLAITQSGSVVVGAAVTAVVVAGKFVVGATVVGALVVADAGVLVVSRKKIAIN